MNKSGFDKVEGGVKFAIQAALASFFFLLGGGIFLGFGISGGVTGWRLMALAVGAGLVFGVGGIFGGPKFAGWIGGSAGGLFFPGAWFDRPQPVYGPVEAKAVAGDYEGAIAGFEKLLEEFPADYRTYSRMIGMLVLDVGSPERAAAVLERAMGALPNEAERQELTRLFEETSEELTRRRNTRGRVDLELDETE